MGKLDKGLYVDCAEQDQPQGTYRFAKNIIEAELLNTIENEYGFKNLDQHIPDGYTLIGVIPVRDAVVLFSTDNTASEIGLLTLPTPAYTQLLNDPDLNFNTIAPIKGEYRKSIDGNRVISWIDDLNSPRILDIDNVADVDSIADLEVFPDITNPELTSPVINDNGGALETGSYIPITQYKNIDGTYTNWFVHDFTFQINDDAKSIAFNENDGAAPGTVSNKSISFNLENLDTNYQTISIGYLTSINNIVTAHKVTEVTVNSTISVTLTGNESIEDISIDEVLTSTANYNNAKAITQLAGRLYLGNLSAPELPDLQAIAMDIKVDYTRTLVDVVSNTGSHKDTLLPTFMPGEVYALYLGVELKKGGWGFYHIPGRAAVAGDTTTVVNEGMTYKRFQVENRSDQAGAYSTMGYWENDGENYPDDVRFVGAITGDQRGTPVRHHRFPLLGYITETYYSGNSSVGITQLPAFGISVSNVLIPAEIQSEIRRWKIFFAKKETSNSLVQGSDLLQFGADRSGRIHSTGGNWDTHGSGLISTLNKATIRSHSLDMLYSDKNSRPTYFHTHYKLKKINLNSDYEGFRQPGGSNIAVSVADAGFVTAAMIDFTIPSEVTRSNLKTFKSLNEFVYIPENAIKDTFSTEDGTGEFVGEINNIGSDFDGITKIKQYVYGSILHPNTQFTNTAGTFSEPSISTIGEETCYIQFFNLLSSVHSAFQTQTLVPTFGYADPSVSTATINGGDSFLCYMSYLSASQGYKAGVSRGTRMWKAYIGYSKYNFNYRYETPGTIGTFYHGKTDIGTLFTPAYTPGNLLLNETTVVSMAEAQNIINYTEDYNRMNVYVTGTIFHPSLVQVTSFPNTVVYSQLQSQETLEFSWRSFPAGNRTVVGQNRGDIINLQGFRNRQLLIHTEDSLFRTRTDLEVNANADSENIFFQSANLFELPPEELFPTDNGYAGTQHKFGCSLTKAGYVFPDNKQGKVFIYNGDGLEEISSNGMRTFFRDFMRGTIGDNPFVSEGYTIGFDEQINRVILSKKKDGQSWTISYNPVKKAWISYHDYIPDVMFRDNKGNLYSYKDNVLYLHNGDPTTTQKGQFYDEIESSFIDVVYNPETDKQKVFTQINWTTESYPVTKTTGQQDNTLDFNNTFTHVTLRNPDQCTGRITLSRITGIDDLYSVNLRNGDRNWEFNGFRDVMVSPGFLKGFYDDFTIDTTKLDTNAEWFEQRKFIDKYLICRLEYDNVINKRLILVDNSVNYRYGR